jgi:hypothetical protein
LKRDIPSSQRVAVFLANDQDKTPKLSVNPADGSFITEIRLDRLGSVNQLARILRPRHDLYVFNESSLPHDHLDMSADVAMFG